MCQTSSAACSLKYWKRLARLVLSPVWPISLCWWRHKGDSSLKKKKKNWKLVMQTKVFRGMINVQVVEFRTHRHQEYKILPGVMNPHYGQNWFRLVSCQGVRLCKCQCDLTCHKHRKCFVAPWCPSCPEWANRVCCLWSDVHSSCTSWAGSRSLRWNPREASRPAQKHSRMWLKLFILSSLID